MHLTTAPHAGTPSCASIMGLVLVEDLVADPVGRPKDWVPSRQLTPRAESSAIEGATGLRSGEKNASAILSDYERRCLRCPSHGLQYPIGGNRYRRSSPCYCGRITLVWLLGRLECTLIRSLMQRYQNFSPITRKSSSYTAKVTATLVNELGSGDICQKPLDFASEAAALARKRSRGSKHPTRRLLGLVCPSAYVANAGSDGAGSV